MTCQHETDRGRQDPPEPPSTCGEDVLEGNDDYCADHLPLHDPDLADALVDADLTTTINELREQP